MMNYLLTARQIAGSPGLVELPLNAGHLKKEQIGRKPV
jgi:hypothetical protein